MAALDYLRDRGFSIRQSGNRVKVSPASKLTEDVRSYIQNHRLELLAELASGDGQARRMHWTVKVPGHSAITMIGPPCTLEDAQAYARSVWPHAEVCW